MFAACAPAPSVEIINACTHLLVFTALLGLKVMFRIKPTVKGLLRWCDSVGQYGIKVSFWGSGTLKIVTLVENHPQKRVRVCFGWMIITPLEGSGVY